MGGGHHGSRCCVPAVLVIYCHIINYPKTKQPKTTNTDYLPQFLGSGTQEQLSWVVLALGLSWGCSQAVSRATVSGGTGVSAPSIRTWLLAGGFSSWSCEPLLKAAHDRASSSASDPREEECARVIRRAAEREATVFYNLISGVSCHLFCPVL